jgi:acyl-CoA reductase-like NAD-dependent aldehyde dehydrogenase
VAAAAFGAFLNQGRICVSTERLVADETVADEFVSKLAAKAARLPACDLRGHVVLGPLIDASAAQRMERLIAHAAAKGTVLAAGGTLRGQRGACDDPRSALNA